MADQSEGEREGKTGKERLRRLHGGKEKLVMAKVDGVEIAGMGEKKCLVDQGELTKEKKSKGRRETTKVTG